MAETGTLKGRYSSLESTRQVYLQRGIDCSTLTIPSLVPPMGHSAATPFRTPFQALGARGVNNLAAKLLLTLLPPNARFFRLYISEILLEKLSGQEGMRADVEEAFDRMERAVMGEIESSNLRTALFEALKQLLVAGNVLLYIQPQGGMKVFRLDRYVVKRDPAGNVLEIVTKESLSPMELPDSIRSQVESQQPTDAEKKHEDTINLYTQILRTNTGWKISQEVNGVDVPESHGTYPLKKSPWIALRFIAVDGEDYGRSYVEEYLGDLQSLEGLTKAIVQASAAAAKVLFLIKPNSTIKHDVLAKAESGAIREGNGEDVSVVQMEKFNDFKVALETISKLETRLEYAFLLSAAIQRNAERVTAEEIRYMANELEIALGGIYSTLGQELQLPIVTRIMFQMERQGKLPVLPDGMVKPAIITGVEGIGRGNDLVNLKEMLNDLAPLGPEMIQQELNVSDYIKRVGAARGIDMKGLIPTAAQRQERQQQQQQQAAMQHLGPQTVAQLGGLAKESLKQQGAAQPQQ